MTALDREQAEHAAKPLVVVVDATNQAHIAYWGSRGQCNISTTMLDRAAAMAAAWSPQWLAFAFDTGHSFRRDLAADYKAHRAEKPPGMAEAIFDAARDLEQAGWPVLGVHGFEADDLIATVCRQAVDQGHRVVIVSADKDVRQCLRRGLVTMCDRLQLARGRLIPSYQTWAQVQEKFGVTPAQWIDFQALVGDKTDGIRGADGIGAVIAAKLLQAAGTLTALLADPFRFASSDRVCNSLFEFRGRAELTRQLVTLRTDAPVTCPACQEAAL